MQQQTLTQMWDDSIHNNDDNESIHSEILSENLTDSVLSLNVPNDFHLNNENIQNDSQSVHSSHSSQVTLPVVYEDSDNDMSFESTQINVPTGLLTQPFATSNTAGDTAVAVGHGDIDLGEDSSIENNIDVYHYFLQTELGLYHDNLAHKENVEYLEWVLEKYDNFLLERE